MGRKHILWTGHTSTTSVILVEQENGGLRTDREYCRMEAIKDQERSRFGAEIEEKCESSSLMGGQEDRHQK